MIPASSVNISWKYIYRKICYNRDIRTMLRHFWIVSGWQRYFSISVPLTPHYKKCPVMWTIIELISKNPEISLSSRNNPEMSQRSSDVPIVENFSIYIFPGYVHWTGWYHLKYYFSIDHHSFGMSETFKKSQMSEFFDVSAGCKSQSWSETLSQCIFEGRWYQVVDKTMHKFDTCG